MSKTQWPLDFGRLPAEPATELLEDADEHPHDGWLLAGIFAASTAIVGVLGGYLWWLLS